MVASAHKTRITALMRLALACLLCSGGIVDTHAEVAITGIDAKIRDNILAYLRLNEETCDSPDWRVRRLFADADTQIREALEVVGYYHAGIEKTLEEKTLEMGDTCWLANFTIMPGQPVVLRNVSLKIDTSGVQDSELENVVQKCALNPGDVLQHADYEACRRRITRTAADRGYFAARFTERRIDVYTDEYAADITLHFITGPRYVFGAITFDQDVMDPDMIQRFVIITPGEPYDAERVRRMQRYLFTSAYFDQVLLSRNTRDEPYFDVPIHLELTPGKKYRSAV